MRHPRIDRVQKNVSLIDRHMNLGELVAGYPELSQVLMSDYGLHCVGCFASSFDTLEEGARVHGFNDKEIDKMVLRLNRLVKKNEKK